MNKNIPMPVPFSYKGKQITFQPFTVKDHLELSAYMRDIYMTEAKKHLTGLPLDLAKFAYQEAKAYADNIQPGMVEYNKAFSTPEGIAYAFWMMLRKSEPTATLEDAMLSIEENAETFEKVAKVVGYEQPDPLAIPGEGMPPQGK